MNDLRLLLDQKLSLLEAQRELLDGTIAEVHRRYSVLDDVESWNLLAQGEITQENGKDHLFELGEQQKEPELIPRDMEETQTFDVNGVTKRARKILKH